MRRLRTVAGLTVSQLAKLADIDEQALREVEEGSLAPSITLLWSLANALSVPFSSLLQDAPSVALEDARAEAEHAPVPSRLVPPSAPRGSVARRSLLPSENQRGRGTEVHELKLEPQSVATGALYPRGARETVLVTAGAAIVRVGDRQTVLRTGQADELDAHAARSYFNPHGSSAVLYILITPPSTR